MHYLIASLIFFMILSPYGCEAIWNSGNRQALKTDLTELLKRYGVSISNSTCNMIGTRRSATCELRLSIEQITLIVKGLNLKEWEGGSPSENNLRTKIPDLQEGCLVCNSFKNIHRIQIYISARRPPELQLKSGSTFEYFILFQDLESNKVCIQVSYAYG